MAEAYESHFKSRLKYLSTREDFVSIFDYNEYKIDFYNDSLDYIDKNGINSYGGLAFARAADFLNYIEETPYESI